MRLEYGIRIEHGLETEIYLGKNIHFAFSLLAKGYSVVSCFFRLLTLMDTFFALQCSTESAVIVYHFLWQGLFRTVRVTGYLTSKTTAGFPMHALRVWQVRPSLALPIGADEEP